MCAFGLFNFNVIIERINYLHKILEMPPFDKATLSKLASYKEWWDAIL
jgi:hypothetical protein